MGMDTYIVGFRPPDELWQKHLAVWKACKAASVEIPSATLQFFNHTNPSDKPGMEISLGDAVTDYAGEASQGYELDVRKLPADVKIIRFYNSW